MMKEDERIEMRESRNMDGSQHLNNNYCKDFSPLPYLFSLLIHGVGLGVFLIRPDVDPPAPPHPPMTKVYFVTLTPEVAPEVHPPVVEQKKMVASRVQKKTPQLVTFPPTVAAPSLVLATPAAPPVRTIPPHYQAGSRENPLPSYPYVSRKRGEEGQIICVVKVNPQGQPEHIDVQESSGFERLDQAAQKTLQTWVFEPAQRGGQKIYGIVQISITFRLTEGVKI